MPPLHAAPACRPTPGRPSTAGRALLHPPPRVTNTGSELAGRDDFVKPPPERINLGVPFHEAGGGPEADRFSHLPLEQRVSTQLLDALFSDDIDEADTAYWFTCPAGGWPTKERVAVAAQECEPLVVTAVRPEAETWRTRLETLRIGTELEGTVSGSLYTAGVMVDIGAEVDGLLCIPPDRKAWKPLAGGKMNPGLKVVVRIAAITYAPLARFPVKLDLVSPAEFRNVFTPGAAAGPGGFDVRADYRGIDNDTMDALTDGAFYGGRLADAPVLQADELLDATQRLDADIEAWGAARAAARARAAAEAAGDAVPADTLPPPLAEALVAESSPGWEPGWGWAEGGDEDWQVDWDTDDF